MSSQVLKMEKTQVRENFYRYGFIEADGESIHSIFVFIDNAGTGPVALILDTAFPANAQMVKDDLLANGIKPEKIVLSHHHPDHAGGCSVFPGCPIYASHLYEDNFENCKRWRPDISFIRPTYKLKDGDTLTFGSFNFKFSEAPGHSKCSLLTLINDDVLHIGDLLMFDVGDKLTLPYISTGGSFRKYIQTLEKLKTMRCNTMIIPHGVPLDEKDKINTAIDSYIYYLKMVLNSKGTLPLSSCMKDATAFCHPEYHDTNLIQLLME